MGWRSVRRRVAGRFYLAFAFTVVVVSYVAVPMVVWFLDAVGAYNPIYYEPKDFARQAYLEQRRLEPPSLLSWEVLFKIALLVAVAVVWRVVMPSRPPDHRTPFRR